MRLVFYTYSYTDRLEMPVEECLERIARAGYAGIDVSGTHGKSDDPASVSADFRRLQRQTAERLNLRIEGVITHAELTASLFTPGGTPLDLVGSVDLAAELGADLVTFHMGGYAQSDAAGMARDVAWRRTAEAIRQAADHGDARHVRLAVDGIWSTWLDDSPDALARLFDDVGSANFGVNFDPSYLTLAGVDPVDFARRFADRIMHAHLKDHDMVVAGDGEKPAEWRHRIPGEGEMDYVRVFAALEEIEFAGAAAVECFTDMEFATACDDGYAAMVASAAATGIRFQR